MKHQPEIGRRRYFEMLCSMDSKEKDRSKAKKRKSRKKGKK